MIYSAKDIRKNTRIMAGALLLFLAENADSALEGKLTVDWFDEYAVLDWHYDTLTLSSTLTHDGNLIWELLTDGTALEHLETINKFIDDLGDARDLITHMVTWDVTFTRGLSYDRFDALGAHVAPIVRAVQGEVQ